MIHRVLNKQLYATNQCREREMGKIYSIINIQQKAATKCERHESVTPSYMLM